MPQTTREIIEAVLFVYSSKGKKRKPENGPLGSPSDKTMKKSGLPFGIGNAGPTG